MGIRRIPTELEDHQCGALGPTLEDGTIVCCPKTEHRDTVRHRIFRKEFGELRWARAYEPVVQDGQLVRTKQPDGLPGPKPRALGTNGNGQQKPAWDPQQQLDVRRKAKARLERLDAEHRAQAASKSARDLARHHAHLDKPGAVAAAIGVPWCADVELDHLPHHTHLAWWVAAGVVQDEDVLHVCHEPEHHRHEIRQGDPGHRCVCPCGRVTRSTVGAALPPTKRPEKKLDTGEDPQ